MLSVDGDSTYYVSDQVQEIFNNVQIDFIIWDEPENLEKSIMFNRIML